jgi:starch-binding outer membrane protein SusE/F
MKKILLLLAILLGNVAITRAQDAIISLIGAGITDWSTDVELETFDGVTYSLDEVEFKGGPVKFRQDNDWVINWGGTFPSATGVQGGADIMVPAGIWNVTIDITTGVYAFTAPAGSPAIVTIYGSALGKASIILTSADGENYATTANIYDNGVLMVSSLKDGVTTLWAGSEFPSGTVQAGDTGIAVTSGSYAFSINIATGAYAFTPAESTFPSVGIIGSATTGDDTGWAADIDMSTEDGINYSLKNVTLFDGAIKFRQDNDWAINWGGTAFIEGQPSGDDITAIPGTYDIFLNRFTGVYSFIDSSLSTADFSGASSFSIYPNPTSGTLNFTSAQNVSVYDLSGRLVAQAANATSVDVSGLVKGIYLVKTDNGVSKQFIVK